MNFIEMFLDYTRDGESPTSFFRWAAISCLSAVMRDNVYLDFGLTKVYPNIYVLLVANSGACRKGAPLKQARKLIEKIGNSKFVAGHASIQGVLRSLATTETPKEIGQEMLKGASGMLYSEELSAFIIDDPAAIPILTDWYDYHLKWDNTLVSGVSQLHDVCVSMLAASNEMLLREVYKAKALYGGLLARTFLIVESKRRKKNSLMHIDLAHYNSEPLLKHLKLVSKLKGPIELADDAKQCYDEWYNSIEDEQYQSKTGFIERIHTGILKLAVCLCASEYASTMKKLVVTKAHIEQAIELAWSLKRNYEELTMKIGNSPINEPIAYFLRELGSAKEAGYQLSRSEIIRRLFADIDAPTLDNVVVTLEGGGLIKTTSVFGETGYQLTPKALVEVFGLGNDEKKAFIN